ncbi:MAG: hypothetical protein HFJ04_04480 [Lachnospiraceae bacterium]|nr:hypothetical protein [Lachnospiraceae bacterium]
MKRKTGFWQLRVIVPGICLFLIMVTNNVYGSEFSTGQTEEMLQEIRSEQIQESGVKNVQEPDENNAQENGEESTQESDGENNQQDAAKKAAIKAKEIDLGDYQTTMEIGESQLLTVTVLPVDATDQTVSYASDNEEVATVNSMGRIRANAAGTAKIKVSCGSVKESFSLTVLEPKDTEEKIIAVTDIEISDYEKELEADKTMTLTAAVLPADATENTISYRSSDPNIATVNSSGEVKGIAKGNVIIYCSAGGITKEIPVTVIVATEKLRVDHTYLVLKPGETETLKATVMPAGAPQGISYKSSNSEIAYVTAGGVVTAKSCGNTSIIVSNKDTSISVSVIVNESVQNKNPEEEKRSESQNNGIEFPEETDISETPVITSEMLHFFYQKSRTLSVHGDGYTIVICGEDIVNDKNELCTQIAFHREAEGTVFELNEGKELCGPVTLCLDQPVGTYLYLYNTSKGAYQLIEHVDMTNLKLTTGGNYLLAEKRLSGYRVDKMAIAGGMLCCIAAAVVYIKIKKKYWFW